MDYDTRSFIPDRVTKICDSRRENVKELAASIGMPYSTFNNYANGTSEPKANFFVALYQFGINLDWFITGEGAMYRADRADHRQDVVNHGKGAAVVTTGVNNGTIVAEGSYNPNQIKGGRGLRLCQWIEDYVAAHSEDECAWLEIEVSRHFAEYVEWKRGKG